MLPHSVHVKPVSALPAPHALAQNVPVCGVTSTTIAESSYTPFTTIIIHTSIHTCIIQYTCASSYPFGVSLDTIAFA